MSLRYTSVFLILSIVSNVYPYSSMNPFGHAMMGPKIARATGFDRTVGADMNRRTVARPDIHSLQTLASQMSSCEVKELAHIKTAVHELASKIEDLFALTESAAKSVGRIEECINIEEKNSSELTNKEIRMQLETLEFFIKYLTETYGSNLEQLNSIEQIRAFDVTIVSLLKTIVVNWNRLLQLN